MRGPSEAAKRLHGYIGFDEEPMKFFSLLVRIIEGEGHATGDEALELAERWLSSFKKFVAERIADETLQSRVPCCEVTPTNEDYVQGPCFVSPNASVDEIQQKKLRANKVHYIRSFSALGNDDFEVLCARVLSLWRVEKEFVSRRSADQGVDFFGRVPFGEILKPSAIGHGAERQLKLWLVGQAKNYSASQVSTKDIRELVGSVNLARSKTYAGSIDPLSQLEMRTCDPVFFLFFTTGNISKDAWSLLSKSGVVAMDGAQLAVFLADHGVGVVNGCFDHVEFLSWVHVNSSQ